MHILNILVYLICNSLQINGIKYFLVRKNCREHPSTICKQNGFNCAKATSQNINILLEILNKNCIKSAYVSGWNNIRADFVLTNNGTLSPYNKYTNDADYAFCYKCVVLPDNTCVPKQNTCLPQPNIFTPKPVKHHYPHPIHYIPPKEYETVVCPPTRVVCSAPEVICNAPEVFYTKPTYNYTPHTNYDNYYYCE